MLKLVTKTIGLSFYRQHIGLFLVVFYLFFGAVEGSQLISYHYAILMAICSSPFILLLLFGVWVLYALKSVFFVKQQLKGESYAFMKEASRLPRKQQYHLWLKTYAFLLLPILSYALLIIAIAIMHQLYWSVIAIIFGLVLLHFALVGYTYRFTNFAFKMSKQWVSIPSVKLNRPFWLWPLFHLLNEQRLMLFACKVLSLLFLKAMLLLFADVGNDIRVYLTVLLTVVLSHAILIFNLIKFDVFYRSFARSLAINRVKTLLNWVILLMLLLIPELGLLIWLTDFDILRLAYELLFCCGAMLFLFVLIYVIKADMERYMKCLLFFFFTTMLSVLAGYYVVYSLTLLICSTFVFLCKYPRMDLRELM
ncbi:MAG TPA: hypothetical protein VL088_07930 [Pedobacter sp.]|nr:hypothetical protein [Pedobacter sp.]